MHTACYVLNSLRHLHSDISSSKAIRKCGLNGDTLEVIDNSREVNHLGDHLLLCEHSLRKGACTTLTRRFNCGRAGVGSADGAQRDHTGGPREACVGPGLLAQRVSPGIRQRGPHGPRVGPAAAHRPLHHSCPLLHRVTGMHRPTLHNHACLAGLLFVCTLRLGFHSRLRTICVCSPLIQNPPPAC